MSLGNNIYTSAIPYSQDINVYINRFTSVAIIKLLVIIVNLFFFQLKRKRKKEEKSRPDYPVSHISPKSVKWLQLKYSDKRMS